MNKTNKIIGWTLGGIVAFIFIASGLFKLSGGNEEMIRELGGANKLIALGILEVGIAIIFLFPRTGIIGSLLMIAYIGGAMAVHFVGEKPLLPLVVIEILIWMASALRFPELIQRLMGKTPERAL